MRFDHVSLLERAFFDFFYVLNPISNNKLVPDSDDSFWLSDGAECDHRVRHINHGFGEICVLYAELQ